MRKQLFSMLMLALVSAAAPINTEAQGLRGLAKKAVQGVVNESKVNAQKKRADAQHEAWEARSRGNQNSSTQQASNNTQTTEVRRGRPEANNGNVFYVSPNGSGRAAGTQESPMKDIQKAIDKAENGDIIRIAAGNYLGTLDQGYVQIKKYVTIQGGYSEDFSSWDPVKYKTYIQPGPECAGTNGNYGLFDLEVTGNVNGTLIIDGIAFDKGEENLYCAYNPKDEVTASPEGCLTGRMLKVGETPKGAKVGGADINKALMYGKVEGNFIVRNCTFVNGNNFAIQVSCVKGHFDIYNNVFCANVMAALESRGMSADMNDCTLSFHNNTVMFTWTRNKVLEDMGQGFRFMPGYCKEEVRNNIFGCNILGAIERTHFDSNKAVEAKRYTDVTGNAFFMNHADLILPSGGGKWLYVKAKNFEDVDEKYLTIVEGNKELQDGNFASAVDQAYLKGFAGLKMIQSQSYDANSSANQFNRAFGLNQQGTEIVRPSMFANKYPFFKAFDLYGAVQGVGAQTPRKE